MRKAAVWTAAATGASAVFQLLQLAIAARYLHAADFGLLAIVNVVLWVIGSLQDMGLSSYCVHLGEQGRRANSTLFWISTSLGCVAAGIVAGVALPLQYFYAMPGLATLLLLLSLNFVSVGLAGQYQAHLIRVFRAEQLAKAELCARVITFMVVLLCLTQLNLGVVSVILGHLVFGASKLCFVVFLAESNWHPRFEFDGKVGPAALKYGAYQALSAVANQLRQQFDLLIIGRVLGAEGLGVYSLAKELLSYPMRVMQPLIGRLILPRLAAVKNDKEALRVQLLQAMRLTANGSAFVHVTLTLLSFWVVEIIYGDRFQSVIPVLALLTIFSTLRPLAFVVGMLAQATGKTVEELRWSAWSWLFTLPTLMILALVSAETLSFAVNMSLTQVVLSVALHPLYISRLISIRRIDYLLTWVLALIVSAVGAGLVYFIVA